MAQTTNAGSVVESVSEYSITNGSTWVAMCGWEMGMSYDSWDRDTGDVKTVCGDEAIMGKGKLNLTGQTVNAVYSDGDASDLFSVAQTAFVTAGGGQFMLRHSPQGTASGKDYIQTNVDAIIDSFTNPNTDATDAAPLSFSFHVITSGYDYSTN